MAMTDAEAMASRRPLELRGVRALLPERGLVTTGLTITDGVIAGADAPGVAACDVIEGAGLLALPGIVDLHGDAFEHLLMPRSGVAFPVAVALAEVDRQLLANGITTAYHGITYSWEPGLRGRETVVQVLDGLERYGDRLGCDTHVHLRHELHNVAAEQEIRGWIRAGRIGLLALNDHLAMIQGRLDRAEKLSEYAERSGLDADAYRALVERVAAAAPGEVAGTTERLCGDAVAAGIPIASHDDETPALRRHYRALGSTVCEFPCNPGTAREAVAHDETVVLGAPNVLRGGSHDARLHATDAIRAGLCNVLASDYYYPAAVHAAFQLARDDVLDLAAAWDLVSAGPARAAGFADRGTLAPGQRADIVLVEPDSPLGPRVVATLVGGALVHVNDPAGRLRVVGAK